MSGRVDNARARMGVDAAAGLMCWGCTHSPSPTPPHRHQDDMSHWPFKVVAGPGDKPMCVGECS